MLKNLLLAIAPLALIVSTVSAEDDLFNLSAASISDAKIEIEEPGLGEVDVDGLAAEAGDSQDEAVEACFRRFGYGNRGYGYGYGYSYYQPCYTYTYYTYPTLYCYRPVYYYTPVYHYWGCY